MSSNALIDELLEAMPPPNDPIGNIGDWHGVEESLGIALPSDYKQFIQHYGKGVICSFVYVADFLAMDEMSPIEFVRITHAPYREFREFVDYAIYPEPQGLIPLAHTKNGDIINWRNRDTSEDIVVSESHCDEFVLFEGYSFCRFILGLRSSGNGILKDVPFPKGPFQDGLYFTSIN